MGFEQNIILALSERAKRKENEDFIYPDSVSEKTNVYVLCDGVGGHHKGEVASKLVAESIAYYLKKKNPFFLQNRAYLINALRFAEERISLYLEDHPENKGMASTAVCLEFIGKKALGFWVGDSRIYHLRNGEILFKSKDHSLVQKLIETENPDKEEIDDFPFKHLILKAIKGNSHPVDPDTFIRRVLKKNDVFVLLSDGILEAFEENELVKLISKHIENSQELEQTIRNKCEEKSKDNYSIQVVKITDI